MRLCVFLLLAGVFLGVAEPALAEGKGGIHGVVTARAHKDLIAKVKALADDPKLIANPNPYVSSDGSIIYTFDMVNYRSLEEIFVGYVEPRGVAPITHELEIDEDRFRPRSLAIATGDILKIENDTDQPLTFYIAKEDSDEILETDPIPPGDTGTLTVTLEGLLELGADENDKSVFRLLSLPNLVSKRMELLEIFLLRVVLLGSCLGLAALGACLGLAALSACPGFLCGFCGFYFLHQLLISL